MLSTMTTMASGGYLTRGEATEMIVENFKLQDHKSAFLDQCNADLEICLFHFSGMTRYEELRIDPLILYPDVFPAHPNYEAINLATKLDLVRGYINAENSPFLPQKEISKVEALKIVLGASETMKWKDNYEYSDEIDQMSSKLQNLTDISENIMFNPDNWWKIRYYLFGIEKGILENFDPDSKITVDELNEMMKQTSL
ncbi:hypothetical protein GF376_02780 [Candidatus Peregrinibacteria bacterium]|nr:hypothetical protein [Candidatus Peregrinibacteria bacterium]